MHTPLKGRKQKENKGYLKHIDTTRGAGVFYQPGEQFITLEPAKEAVQFRTCFGFQEAASVCVFAPKRAFKHVFRSLKGNFEHVFWLPRSLFRMCSRSQKGN